MATPPTLKSITVEALLALENRRQRLYEIWDETLREKPVVTKQHSDIETFLIVLIGGYVLSHKLGKVGPGDLLFIIEGTKKRIIKGVKPDVSFIAAGRAANIAPGDFYTIAPDLAIEIISPSEEPHEIAAKIRAYLDFGTRLVVIIYPTTQEAVLHHPTGEVIRLGSADTLTFGEVVPGLAIPVADIFAAAL